MSETYKRDILAEMRTLLALERNYLAEKRTELARLRTGLAILLIVPPVYLFAISLNIEYTLLFIFLFYMFLTLSSIWGIWLIFHSRTKLRILRKMLDKVKQKEKEMVKKNREIYNIFENVINFE